MPPLGSYQPVNKRLAVAGAQELLWEADAGVMAYGQKLNIVTDLDVYVAFDRGDPNAATALELRASEAYSDDGVLFSFMSFVNKNPGERPTVRGIVWGA